MSKISCEASLKSVLMSNGEASMLHMENCAFHSFKLCPPFPIWSKSGRFQWPGPAYAAVCRDSNWFTASTQADLNTIRLRWLTGPLQMLPFVGNVAMIWHDVTYWRHPFPRLEKISVASTLMSTQHQIMPLHGTTHTHTSSCTKCKKHRCLRAHICFARATHLLHPWITL